ncbi:MAG: hypothetical protein AAB706_03815 [Patescibacteria group bacterium]
MDKTFLHSLFFDLIIPETIQWATFVILLILVFSPFIVISIKRFKLAKWYFVPFAYALSWFIHFELNFYLVDSITTLLARLSGLTNIVLAMENSRSNTFLGFFLLWPLSTFWILKILNIKFNLRNLLLSFIVSLGLGTFIWQYLIYGISDGFGGLLF